MDLTIKVELGGDVEKRLAEIVGKEKALPEMLAPYAQAAFLEYVDMMVGQRLINSAADLREYRLFRLCAALGTVPDDEVVGSVFQLTAGQSRALIRVVAAKYQYALEKYLNQALYDSIKPKADEFELSPNLVEFLRLRAERLDAKLEPITKVPNKGLYKVPAGTRLKLMQDLEARGVSK